MNKRFIFILFSCFGDCFHLGKYIWLTAYYNGTCFDCVVTFIFCYQCVLSCVLVLASQAQLTCKWSRNWFVSTEVMNTFPSLFPSFSLFWCGNISALANLLQCNLSDSFSLNIHHIRLLNHFMLSLYSSQLFHFDVHEDVRTIADATIEKDEVYISSFQL